MKTGKSTFGSRLPKSLFLNFENGINALSGIRAVPILRWGDFKKVLSQLKKEQAREMYDSIVVDTSDIAFNLCEQYICQQNNVESIRDIPWGAGFGLVKQEFQECFRQLALLGYGILFIAHSKEVPTEYTDADGNPISQIRPRLSSGAVEVINGMVDIIAALRVNMKPDGTSERYLLTRATPRVFAGSRYAYLSPKIDFGVNGYNELVNAIGDAIDKAAELDGANVVEHAEVMQVTRRPFEDTMEEAKYLWINYLDIEDIEQKEYRHNILKEIVRKVFGNANFKISSATPGQQDLVELFIDEVKNL